MTTAERQRQASADNLLRGARQGVERLQAALKTANKTVGDKHAPGWVRESAARRASEIEEVELPRARSYLRECRERAGESL